MSVKAGALPRMSVLPRILVSQDGNTGQSITVAPGTVATVLQSRRSGDVCDPELLTFEITASPSSAGVPANSTHLPRMLVVFGTGADAHSSALVDLRHGMTLSLSAVSFLLSVDLTTPRDVGGALPVVGPTYEVGASVAYGARPARSVGDVVLTTQRQDLGAGAGLVAPFAIPTLATHVAFVTGAAVAAAAPLQLAFAADAVSVARELVAPARGVFTPIPNGAELLFATDISGAPQPSVSFLFAINL